MRGLIALSVFCIAAAGCGSVGGVIPDCYSVGRYKQLVQPSFDLYVMNVKAETGSRIDLYVQMPYERLHFVKTDTGYGAAYTVLFVFRDGDGESVQSKEITRTVTSRSYEPTVSQVSDAFLQSMILPPGAYTLECTSVDENSLVRYVQRTEVHASAFASDSVTTSSILLLLKSRADEKGTVLHPLLPQTIQYARDSIGVFQEVYGTHRGDTVIVGFRYLTMPAQTDHISGTHLTMVPPYSRFIGSCKGTLDSVDYSARMVFSSAGGTIPLIGYYPVPPEGYSKLERTITVLSSGRMMRTVQEMSLYKNSSAATAGTDIVDAMRFITHEDELEGLQSPVDSVREIRLTEFWDEHGGRERRTEFEHRVAEANKLFSLCVQGSRTPMGITYIVCGPPDAVDCRNPFTETWYYSAGSQVMTVPFRLERRNDETAFYELPINSVDELIWGAYIDRWRRR